MEHSGISNSGAGPANDLAIPSALEAISGMLDQLASYLREHGTSDTVRRRTMLAVEELVANAITHGQAKGTIQIGMRVTMGDVGVQLTYDGLRFDPSDPDALPETNVEELGGNGLMLVQMYASEITYNRSGEKNVVSLVFTD